MYEESVYTVEPNRVQVRTWQVNCRTREVSSDDKDNWPSLKSYFYMKPEPTYWLYPTRSDSPHQETSCKNRFRGSSSIYNSCNLRNQEAGQRPFAVKRTRLLDLGVCGVVKWEGMFAVHLGGAKKPLVQDTVSLYRPSLHVCEGEASTGAYMPSR